MSADQPRAEVAPLAYREQSADATLAHLVIRVLAGIGMFIGSIGVLSTTSLWATGSDFFRPRLFTFGPDVAGRDGWLAQLMWANMLAMALAFVVLVPSSVAAWRLHPAGRRGMLWFAVLALTGSGVQVLARAIMAAGLVTLGRSNNPLNLAIWVTSGVLQIAVEAAYPVIVLLVLRTPHVRAAFMPGRRSGSATVSAPLPR